LDAPYIILFAEKDFTDLSNAIDGNYQGIGVMIEEKEGYIEIVSVSDGSPAQRLNYTRLDYTIGESIITT